MKHNAKCKNKTAEAISPLGQKKGAWSRKEDELLRKSIEKYGEGNWHLIPQRAGLNRCRKSCRLRWLNYLKPNINRAPFSSDEIDLIIRLHKLLGNKWTLIAGRLPGRTANDVKNFWNSHLCKKIQSREKHDKEAVQTQQVKVNVIKPRPHALSRKLSFSEMKNVVSDNIAQSEHISGESTHQILPSPNNNDILCVDNMVHEGEAHIGSTCRYNLTDEWEMFTNHLTEEVSNVNENMGDCLADEGAYLWDELFLNENIWDVFDMV